MKLLIADDHDLVRESFAALLRWECDADVCEAGSLTAALEKISAEGPFDLVILDYVMPGMNGLEGLARVVEAAPGQPVAILSGLASRDMGEAALAAGAVGFVPKSLPARAVVSGVQNMIEGKTFLPLAYLAAPDAATAPGGQQLTKREIEVLSGICEGKSNKEIARDCDLQEVTVKLHVKTLCRKLGARNRTHAAIIAVNEGIV